MSETKKCNRCGEELHIINFSICKTHKDGLNNYCKRCKQKIDKEYRLNNPDKIKENHKRNYKENKEYILKWAKEYNQSNKSKRKTYNQENRERDKEYLKIYNEENNHLIRPKRKIYNKVNKDKIYQYFKNRLNNEPVFKLRYCLHWRMISAIKSKKGKRSSDIINLTGCSIEECRQHIERQFLPEMNWGNWGPVWELDHILPCASFNLTNDEEQRKCFHFSNLQPLFKTTEIAKSFGYFNHIGNKNKSNKII